MLAAFLLKRQRILARRPNKQDAWNYRTFPRTPVGRLHYLLGKEHLIAKRLQGFLGLEIQTRLDGEPFRQLRVFFCIIHVSLYLTLLRDNALRAITHYNSSTTVRLPRLGDSDLKEEPIQELSQRSRSLVYAPKSLNYQ